MKRLFFAALALFLSVTSQAKPNKDWVKHIQDTFQCQYVSEVNIPWSDKSVSMYEVFAIPTVLDMRATEMLCPNNASDAVFKDCMASSVFSAGFIEGLMERLEKKTAEDGQHI